MLLQRDKFLLQYVRESNELLLTATVTGTISSWAVTVTARCWAGAAKALLRRAAKKLSLLGQLASSKKMVLENPSKH